VRGEGPGLLFLLFVGARVPLETFSCHQVAILNLTSLSLSLSISQTPLSIYLFAHLSVYPSTFPAAYPFTYLSYSFSPESDILTVGTRRRHPRKRPVPTALKNRKGDRIRAGYLHSQFIRSCFK
jgi:hypothetical protein